MRTILGVGLVVLCSWGSPSAVGQDKKPRPEEEIRKELEQTQQKVKALEAELATVVNQEAIPLPDEKFEVGKVYKLNDPRGNVAQVKAVRVVGPNEAIVKIEVGRQAWPTSFLLRTPTEGLADGAYILDANKSFWKLTGTKRVGGQSVYVLESAGPSVPPVKK